MVSFFNRSRNNSGFCCIDFADGHINLAYKKSKTQGNDLEKAEIDLCLSTPYETQSIDKTLATLVKEHGLTNVECSYLLGPSDYRVLRIKKPTVPDTELLEATRWLIQDMINYPPTEALLGLINTPASDARNEIMCAASPLEDQQRFIDVIRQAKLNLTVIDIAEFAMCNFADHLSPQPEKIALIMLQEQSSLLTVYQDQCMYFSRKLEVPLEHLSPDANTTEEERQQVIIRLGNEVHRALEFYRNQNRQTNPEMISILPTRANIEGIISSLKEQVTTEINIFDVNSMVTLPKELSTNTERRCISVIGGVLRT